jgi:predicted ester cyclase
MCKLDLGPYSGVPEFIYGITQEIWEDRGIGKKIKQYYAADCLVRAATGVTIDNAGVTGQTLQTLHQFPDRQLVGEDVIWRSYDDGSFLSSHRLISVMRHQGDGVYGKATGRVVRSRIIADCYVRDQQVKEEWLVRDQAAFARCMGLDPREIAREMVEVELRRKGCVDFFTPECDVQGLYRSECQRGFEADAYREGWGRIWNDKETAAIHDLYFRGAFVAVPGGDVLSGHNDLDQFCLAYLASFPDAELTMQSIVVNRDPGQPVRIAARWSLKGHHTGFGHFGPPTGASVYVMGQSHAHMVKGRVTFEWIVTDEVTIWKQIFAHQESKAGA